MQKRIIIKQQDEKDCGICCLESIIKYYHGFVPLEKIREDTKTTSKGTSAFHMIETLKEYGFDAYGTKIKKEKFFRTDFPLPAIVHVVLDNGLNHYMVLYEKRNDKIILMDPSIGKRVMSDTDFLWIWSEVVLIAYPKEKIIVDAKEESFITMMLRFLGQNKKKLLILIKVEILYLFLSICSSFYLKVACKYLERKYELMIIIFVFFFLSLCNILIQNQLVKKSRILNRSLGLFHTTTYFDHLFNLPLKLYKSRNLNDYLTRFWENFDLKYLYSDFGKNLMISSLKILISFGLLSILNIDFFHYFLLIFLVYFFFQLLIQNQIFKLEKESLIIKNNYQNKLLETLSNFELYHYLNLKENLKENNEKNLIFFLRDDEKKNKFYQTFLCCQNLLKEIINFTFLTLGIHLLYQKKLEVVDFVLIESIGLNLLSSLEMILKMIPKEKYLKTFLKKEADFLTLEKEHLTKSLPLKNNDITFFNVDFTYDKFRYVLKNLTLKVHKNEHIQLFGPSGSGKSTICDLLMKTYSPTNGSIKIGKTNITDIELSSLRKIIVYLNQRSRLIVGTIKENIILDRNYNQERFDRVCEICYLNEFIEKKPLRYETNVSHEENNLSGGEKQRIMLARVLYSNAEIFLLDESLSEIGEKMEKEIIKKIREFLKGKTLIYISHKNYKLLFDEMVKLEVNGERVLIS
jgi:ATP-binding cassette subfamily B protein